MGEEQATQFKQAGLAACAAIVMGSIGPWANLVGFISISASGTDGDGVITLVIGIAAAMVFAFSATFNKGVGVLLLILGGAAGGIGTPASACFKITTI